MSRLSASVALAGVALVGVSVPAFATGNHERPSVCHPTGKGWVLIKPAQASSHIDESAYPAGHYWKHEHDGRHDVYATNGVCPPLTPSPTSTGGTPSPTTTPTAVTPTTATATVTVTSRPTTTVPSPSQTSSTPTSPVTTTTAPVPATTTSTGVPTTTSPSPTGGSATPLKSTGTRNSVSPPSPRRSVPSSTVAPPAELAHTGFNSEALLTGLGILLAGAAFHGIRRMGVRHGNH